MEFNCKFIPKDDKTDLIYFKGDINEDAELALAGLVHQIAKDSIFNLKDVSSINSCGVRAWINFLREVEKTKKITFDECPPEIVSQINMIPNFKGQAEILSVYAGYICDNCDYQHLELFRKGVNLPTDPSQSISDVHCPKCNSVMEMEELEEEFFGWVNK